MIRQLTEADCADTEIFINLYNRILIICTINL